MTKVKQRYDSIRLLHIYRTYKLRLPFPKHRRMVDLLQCYKCKRILTVVPNYMSSFSYYWVQTIKYNRKCYLFLQNWRKARKSLSWEDWEHSVLSQHKSKLHCIEHCQNISYIFANFFSKNTVHALGFVSILKIMAKKSSYFKTKLRWIFNN